MSKVSPETIEKLDAFFKSLPPEQQSKCAICNETLTHTIKTAEVKTGAGTATAARKLAESLNRDAAPGDVVSGTALEKRVRRKAGEVKKTERPFMTLAEPQLKIQRTPQSIITKIVTLRIELVVELKELRQLVATRVLVNDQPLKEIEDQLRLIVAEAEILGLHIVQPGGSA